MSRNKLVRPLRSVSVHIKDKDKEKIIQIGVNNFIGETTRGRQMLPVEYFWEPPFTAVNQSATNRIYRFTGSGNCFFVTPGLDFYMSEGKEDYFYLVRSGVLCDRNYKPVIFTSLTELEYTFL